MNSKEKLTENQTTQLSKIGDQLKKIRIEKGYTNYENFAFDNGLSRANYGRYEKGHNLKVSTLITILECHGMTLDEFFGRF